MDLDVASMTVADASFSLEQQVVRLQALLEASRQVHSNILLAEVLEQAARIAVLELELDEAAFPAHGVRFGRGLSEARGKACHVRFPLLSRAGAPLAEMVIAPPAGRELSIFEIDFLDGLVLQTAVAVENALHHERNLEYARVAQDLEAARAIQQSLLPQRLPRLEGYSLAARSRACYQVGGDYLDVFAEGDGRVLMVVADVAGKGLASAMVCTAFRSAFRALARHPMPLEELAARLSEQHWEEGPEARRRYVTAIFARLSPASGDLELVNAGHNPGLVAGPPGEPDRTVEASGTPLGLLPGSRYTTERMELRPGGRMLLYTDGLTEVFCGDEEFGTERLWKSFRAGGADSELLLDRLWTAVEEFEKGAAPTDDRTAIALGRAARDAGRGAVA